MAKRKKSKADKLLLENLCRTLFRLVEGYQWSFLLFSSTESETAKKLIIDYLEELFPDIDPKQINHALTHFSDWADYHRIDMARTWIHLSECLESGKPVHKRTHDGIDLGKYSMGLSLRNKALAPLFPCDTIGPLVKDKVVVDMGGGAGFWSQFISKTLGARKVFLVDRPEITEQGCSMFLPDNEDPKVISKNFDDLETKDFGDYTPDVFFFSEVLHGKTPGENRSLLRSLTHLVPDNESFTIIVNELCPEKNPLFILQMKLHTRGGGPCTPTDVSSWIHASYTVHKWEWENWGPRHYVASFEVTDLK